MERLYRDKVLENEFRKFKNSPEGRRPYFDALWNTWIVLRDKDMMQMARKTFALVRGNLYLAGLHFNILPEQKKFYDYVVWFMENRLKNTGVNGYTRCEMSELYSPDKDTHR
jgi:hypothetical protein